ncbi:hypothetical protein DINM_022247 [Dirofilaria immitis]|nr:hypothetical protein [Dirofilaria immitis]
MENGINSFGSLDNADQVLAEFGSRQRYVLLITTLLSFNWAIASMPVMHGIFIIDDDCFLNGTASGNDFNLHGNRRYLLEWTTSAFMLGNMIGASTLTYLSDKFGRRPVLISSLLALGIIGLLTSLAENILAFIIGRFIQGFCSPGPLLVGWVLSYESVPIGLRGFVTLMYGVMWVIGYCAIAPLAYFIYNWRFLMIAYSVPSIIIAVIYFLTIPESLHFLIVNGRKQKAAKWIRNAVKYGNVLHKRSVDMMVELLENTCPDVKGSVHALLPTILFGSVALIAGTLTCILPETKECVLPSSLDEAVHINHLTKSKSSKCQQRSNRPTTSSDN